MILYSLLAAVVGTLVYALAGETNTKVAEIGRALMWCGTLVTLFVVSNHTAKLF